MKIFLTLLLAIAVIALSCILWLNHALSPDQLKPRLETEVSRYLGRRFTIDRVGWTLRPVPLLIAENARLYDGLDGVMAEGPTVKLYLDYPALIRGRLVITDLLFQDIQVSLPFGRKEPVDIIQMINQLAARARPAAEPGVIALKQLSVDGGQLILTRKIRGASEDRIPLRMEGRLNFVEPPVLRASLEVSSPTVAVNIEIPNFSERLLSLNIQSRNSEMGDLLTFMKRVKAMTPELSRAPYSSDAAQPWRLKGELGLNRMRVDGNPLDSVKATGEISGDNFTVQWDGKNIPLKLKNTGKAVSRVESVRGGVRGRWSKRQLRAPTVLFHLDASHVRWDEGIQFDSVKSSGTFNGERWSAGIAASTGMIHQMAIQSLSLAYQQESPDQFRLRDVRLQGMGGTIKGDGSVSPSEIEVSWDAVNVDVQKLEQALHQEIYLTGTGNSTGWLRGDHMPWPNQTLDGVVQLQVKNGISTGMPGLLKTLSALNLETFFKKNRKGQKEIPFDTFEATGTVRAGVLQVTHPAKFTNETLDIRFTGLLDLVRKHIDGQFVITFLTVVSEFVRVIPGVKTILQDGKKSIVPMRVTIQGPFDNPRTDAKPLKGVTTGAKKVVDGAILLPERILKKIRLGD